jgi:hypothetical protein
MLSLLAQLVLGQIEEVCEGVAMIDEEVLLDGPVNRNGKRFARTDLFGSSLESQKQMLIFQ